MSQDNGPVFTDEDLVVSKSGRLVRKHDEQTGREIWLGPLEHMPGPYLSITGRGVPGNVHIRCHYPQVNLLARVLLDATFDARLVTS